MLQIQQPRNQTRGRGGPPRTGLELIRHQRIDALPLDPIAQQDQRMLQVQVIAQRIPEQLASLWL